MEELNDSLTQQAEFLIDIDEFDRNLEEVFSNLQSKNILLDECRQELKELILRRQDLERQFMNEKYKNANDEQQNIILQNAAEVLEEERKKLDKELIKLKVQLELLVAERDSLRGQFGSQCVEINDLKRQIDDLSSKRQNQTGVQKDLTEKLQKIKILLNQVNDLIIPLKKQQYELEDISRNKNHIEQLILLIEELGKQKLAAKKERDETRKELIIKTAELSKLQYTFENSTSFLGIMPNEETVLHYWKAACSDLETQLNNEKACTIELTEAIELSRRNEEYLREKLIAKEEKISNLKRCCKSNDTGTQTETNGAEGII